MLLENLRKLRTEKRLTQKQIAEYLGCQREVYRRYEKGIRDLPIDYLVQLCKLYHVSADYLLDLTNL